MHTMSLHYIYDSRLETKSSDPLKSFVKVDNHIKFFHTLRMLKTVHMMEMRYIERKWLKWETEKVM